MGKLNEIQEQVTQSFGNNSFTTKITDTTVEFDSARDSFTFKDEVNVPVIKVDGVQSVPFTADEKAKLATVTTPMNMKGRVDTAAELPTEGVQVGDVYLVGASGSENFEEYICTEISGSPEAPVWENLGHVRVQPDWNQNDATKDDYIKNRICYESTQAIGSAQLDATASFGAGYFTNDCTPIVDGEMYVVAIGNETKTFEATSSGDGIIAINFTFTNGGGIFNYNPNGISSAPNNEKFVFYGGGNPSLWANATVTISQSTIAPIDDKFIPDTVARIADLPKLTVDVISTSPSSSTLLAKEGTYTCAYADGDKTAITFQIDDTSDTTKVHEFEGIVSFGASLTPSLGNLYPVDAAGERILNTTLFTSNNVSASGNYTFKAKWYYRSGSIADLIVEFNRAYNA